MKILLDTCVAGGVRSVLEDAGHDVVWTGDWEQDPGDRAILALAHREGRTLITLDKDFGRLAVVGKVPHSGIVRLVNMTTSEQATVCLTVINQHGGVSQAGAIVTAKANRIRVRPPENTLREVL